jgi:hypothetical protein
MLLLEKTFLCKHPIHFLLVSLTFETDDVLVGMFILLYYCVRVMALCFCLIPRPSAVFPSSELAPMPLEVLVNSCIVQSPLGLRQAYLMSQLFPPINTVTRRGFA